MNYIIHLNKAFAIFCEDERLTPFHISLYFGLFQYWNMAKFRNPISINRAELMRAAKIGSVNTYIRCIKELDKWQYIKYIPSYNPQKGSQVHLYDFNNSNNNATDISNDKGTGKAVKKAGGKGIETQVIPSINNSNRSNKQNNKKDEHKHKSNSSKKRVEQNSTGSKNNGNKSERTATTGCAAPTLKEVKIFFVEKAWPLLEAEKFHNHYESNGWKVGGKTPMQNWKASAANWMLNTKQFFPKGEVKPGKLQTNNDKNYAEPL